MSSQSQQEKMQTDYTWIRSNPAENPRQRVHGYNYIYNVAPNKFERLEMIYRSMGKQFDWELERFRLSRKQIDRGNKRRIYKNLFRFIKNPVGYFYWKTYRLRSMHVPRWMVLGIFFSIINQIHKHSNHSMTVQLTNDMLLRYGKNVEGTPGQYQGYHHTRPFLEVFSFNQFLHYNAQPYMMTLNPTWKQNLRKQFQLLKSYNVDY